MSNRLKFLLQTTFTTLALLFVLGIFGCAKVPEGDSVVEPPSYGPVASQPPAVAVMSTTTYVGVGQ